MMNVKTDRGCTLCPRECGANRTAGEKGYCGVGDELMVARAALHFWEEPCISGRAGSGTIFFSGCQLGCIYCQNYNISRAETGKIITVERLSDIFLELEQQGALNINLVTPSHYIDRIARAIELALNKGLGLPIVYNGSGYDKAESIKLLDGLIDIYLPDFKYFDSEPAAAYSAAPDYFRHASESLREMVRQIENRKDSGEMMFRDEVTGRYIDSLDDSVNAVMQRGVIVRHLLLPGLVEDSKKVVHYLYETYHNKIYISLMSQYTPMEQLRKISASQQGRQLGQLLRAVTKDEYDELVNYAIQTGVENGFIQEGETAQESFIPAFDCTGV